MLHKFLVDFWSGNSDFSPVLRKLLAVRVSVGGTDAGFIGNISVSIFERAIIVVQTDTLLEAVSDWKS